MTPSPSNRIAVVVPAFPKLSERFIVSKVLGLLRRGWDVHIVCRATDPAAWEQMPTLRGEPDLRGRVHVTPTQRRHVLPAAMAVLTREPGIAACYLKSAALRDLVVDARLATLRPDIIHFEFGTLARGRMHLKRRLNCRVVASFRGYDLNFVGLADPEYYTDVWAHADAVHVLGEDLWRRAVRRGCPSNKPHMLIPAAIDTNYFAPPDRVPASDRPLEIVSVGRLAWKKGYEYALEAVALLKERGIRARYTIVGDGDYLEALAFARRQLGLEDDVAFAGALPADAVRDRLAQADIFLHSAVSEGFCNAVLEAQSMELPVVTSDADGLRENVADGETGLVVPRRDSAALADRLETLAANPDLRRTMGKAGRARVLRHFQVDDQIDRFDAFYRGVLAGAVPSHAAEVKIA